MENLIKIRVPEDRFFKSSILHIDENKYRRMDVAKFCKNCKRRIICIPNVNIFDEAYDKSCEICKS